MSKILVVGYFGYCTNQLDGQTVKTRDVYRLVREQVKGKVDYYDTEDFQYHKIGIPELFCKMIRCSILFYLPAQNNLKIIFPIIFCLSTVFRFKIHYFVVGGWLKEFLVKKPIHRFMLKRIEGIHVETKRLENELKLYFHFRNVDNFPNFRFFEFVSYLVLSKVRAWIPWWRFLNVFTMRAFLRWLRLIFMVKKRMTILTHICLTIQCLNIKVRYNHLR